MTQDNYKIIFISLLIVTSFISSYTLILQTYEYRKSFSVLENLKLEKEDLSFQSNLLLEEVKYFKNHISLRKFATESLGMTIPASDKNIYLDRSLVR
jgi:cell division protein FtsL